MYDPWELRDRREAFKQNLDKGGVPPGDLFAALAVLMLDSNMFATLARIDPAAVAQSLSALEKALNMKGVSDGPQ